MIQEGFSEEESSGLSLVGRTRVLIRTEEVPKPLLLSISSLCCGDLRSDDTKRSAQLCP